MHAPRQQVRIPVGDVSLAADIVVPAGAHGVVLFAHGSGSSRHSPRNRHVAAELEHAGLATVLVDLLTPEEERVDVGTRQHRFDIQTLATRVMGLADWLTDHESTAGLGIGLFGASTGAAAALVAAAGRPLAVRAIVSRGGRPDLAGESLGSVHEATLLIVGERDPAVLDLNRQALARLPGEKRLEIVPGATHLFEEPGALEHVVRLTREWFSRHLHRVPPGHRTVDDLA